MQFNYLQITNSPVWNERIDFVKSLLVVLFFIYTSILLVDLTINKIPELKSFSINHSFLIKNSNVIIPLIFEKVRKDSKTNSKKVCACATIIAGLLSKNFALIVWGIFRLKSIYDERVTLSRSYGSYRVNGRSFRYRL
ncbi:hypothetical protein M9Y10_021918 [Tritrichomonas musculus]|uniref:Uncharacterized protein n=1 Tax=Tritrichomonas musculus TaxID=1915356 RepID=A0ABR2KRV8_9EUKA